jgi:hypothetical protein
MKKRPAEARAPEEEHRCVARREWARTEQRHRQHRLAHAQLGQHECHREGHAQHERSHYLD